ERRRLLPLFLWVRVTCAVVFLASMLILAARGEPLARATVRGQILWLIGSLTVAFLNRFVPRVRLWLRWATVVVDLPLFFVVCHDALRAAGPRQSGAIAFSYLAG